MARVVVHAAVQATAQDVRLIVSVSGAEDGLPRSGLASTNFDVVSVASGEDTAPRQQLIAQVVEGPAGIYQLVLDGMASHQRWCRRRSSSPLRSAETRRAAGRTIGDRRSRSAARRSPRRHQRGPCHREVMCVPTVTQRGSRGEKPRRRSAEQETAQRDGHANGARSSHLRHCGPWEETWG